MENQLTTFILSMLLIIILVILVNLSVLINIDYRSIINLSSLNWVANMLHP